MSHEGSKVQRKEMTVKIKICYQMEVLTEKSLGVLEGQRTGEIEKGGGVSHEGSQIKSKRNVTRKIMIQNIAMKINLTE